MTLCLALHRRLNTSAHALTLIALPPTTPPLLYQLFTYQRIGRCRPAAPRRPLLAVAARVESQVSSFVYLAYAKRGLLLYNKFNGTTLTFGYGCYCKWLPMLTIIRTSDLTSPRLAPPTIRATSIVATPGHAFYASS
jgi:hypothetical protein